MVCLKVEGHSNKSTPIFHTLGSFVEEGLFLDEDFILLATHGADCTARI
jgi:hypothetical protein